jgi:hypothetical protein
MMSRTRQLIIAVLCILFMGTLFAGMAMADVAIGHKDVTSVTTMITTERTGSGQQSSSVATANAIDNTRNRRTLAKMTTTPEMRDTRNQFWTETTTDTANDEQIALTESRAYYTTNWTVTYADGAHGDRLAMATAHPEAALDIYSTTTRTTRWRTIDAMKTTSGYEDLVDYTRTAVVTTAKTRHDDIGLTELKHIT